MGSALDELKRVVVLMLENPDAINSPATGFNFTRLVMRVPAILISPWVPRGLVDSVVYDHTALLATVIDRRVAVPSDRGRSDTEAP